MNRRLAIFFCVFAVSSLLLFFRVGAIGTDGSLQETAAEQTRYTLTFGKTRGKIYDCRLRDLTGEATGYVAACLPTPENMAALIKCRELGGSDIPALLDTGRPFLAECTAPALDIPDVRVLPAARRGKAEELAPHLLGYLDGEGNGLTGIEKAYNSLLSAKDASSSVTFTVNGRREPLSGVEPQVDLAPLRTDGVVLTLDSRIQELVEKAGAKYLKKGAVVVMEPATGKLRAAASFPGYSVGRLAEAVKDEENSPLLNRAFSAYNVGSTFKIVTAAEALSEGLSPSKKYFCPGYADVSGQVFKCHLEEGHGEMDMKQAMMASCNPYFIELGLELDKGGFRSMARDLSFGKETLFAPGLRSVAGSLTDLEELRNPADIGNFSFGQGKLTATPVQIARMVSAVVNGGNTPEALLVEGTTQGGKLVEGRTEIPAPVKAMEEKVALQVKDFLVRSVMEEPNQQAKPRYVTAGGKTGTAQTGQFDAEGEEFLNGWFAGFFPAENPEYVMVVLSEEARSGNQDASPVFREVADALNAPMVLPQEP